MKDLQKSLSRMILEEIRITDIVGKHLYRFMPAHLL